MTVARKRGRPKKSLSKFPLGPSPLRKGKLNDQSHFSEMLASLYAAEADLIGGVRIKRVTIKNMHALGLALENELNETEREQLLAADAALRVIEKENVKGGGEESGEVRKKSRDIRVQLVGNKNQQLIAKIKPNGVLSISRAGEILLDRWEELGDGGEIPSLTTARRWLKKLITNS